MSARDRIIYLYEETLEWIDFIDETVRRGREASHEEAIREVVSAILWTAAKRVSRGDMRERMEAADVAAMRVGREQQYRKRESDR